MPGIVLLTAAQLYIESQLGQMSYQLYAQCLSQWQFYYPAMQSREHHKV